MDKFFNFHTMASALSAANANDFARVRSRKIKVGKGRTHIVPSNVRATELSSDLRPFVFPTKSTDLSTASPFSPVGCGHRR